MTSYNVLRIKVVVKLREISGNTIKPVHGKLRYISFPWDIVSFIYGYKNLTNLL